MRRGIGPGSDGNLICLVSHADFPDGNWSVKGPHFRPSPLPSHTSNPHPVSITLASSP